MLDDLELWVVFFQDTSNLRSKHHLTLWAHYILCLRLVGPIEVFLQRGPEDIDLLNRISVVTKYLDELCKHELLALFTQWIHLGLQDIEEFCEAFNLCKGLKYLLVVDKKRGKQGQGDAELVVLFDELVKGLAWRGSQLNRGEGLLIAIVTLCSSLLWVMLWAFLTLC